MNTTSVWLLFASLTLLTTVGAHELGDPCTSSSECSPLRCYEGSCTDKLLNGDSCGSNAACASNSCNIGVCAELANNGEACSDNSNCISTCNNGICADPANNGVACSDNVNCINTCVNSVCVDFADPGEGCDDYSDCADLDNYSCRSDVCTERSEVGGSCDEDGDCLRKLKCNSARCRLNERGESCVLDSDCDGNLSCESAGIFLGDKCGGECFSGLTTVEVKGKGLILMKDLKINDWVRCEDGAYSQVFSFSHYHPNKNLEYLQIHVENETLTQKTHAHRLEISNDHLLYVQDMNTRKKNLVAAESVKVGEWLVSEDGSITQVTGITKVHRRGVYAPTTTSGNILVGGVLASNHVTNLSVKSYVTGQTLHLLQQGMILPYRVYCHVLDCQNETYDEVTGYSSYVMLWFRLVQWILGSHPVLRAFYLVLLAALCALGIFVGAITSASVGTINVFNVLAFSMGYYLWKKSWWHMVRFTSVSPPVKE